MYTLEEVRKSMRLYCYLLEHKELRYGDDKELFLSYNDPAILQLLSALEEESLVEIKKYEDTIYFIPKVDNQLMGYKRAELKREIFTRSSASNLELYVAMFIMITLTAQFYNGKSSRVPLRDFIEIGELDYILTKRLVTLEDEVVNEENLGGLLLTQISNYWGNLINEDDVMISKSRRWYIKCVVDFLKKENLILIQDETMIIPTVKFNRLGAHYFLDFNRLDEIKAVLSRVDKEEETDAKTL